MIDGRELLRQMLRVRRFEERAAELYTQEKIRGFLHLYIGEEAAAAGVIPNLAEDDAVVATYREHGHALVRGIPMGPVMAEMYGKREGVSRGRGGSMHLFDAAARFYGGNAIVAGGLPIAVGLALADRMQGRARVTACFFGDGAAAEGAFHESMNLARLWDLPVLFACENNRYAMGTALRFSHAVTDLRRRALAYDVPAEAVDAMDARAVAAAAERAVAAIRAGQGPVFLELKTYRFRAHSMFDPEHYRTKEEVAAWKEKDPIPRLVAELKAEGALDDASLTALEAAVAAEIDEAVAFAEAGTFEDEADLYRDVLAGPADEAAAEPTAEAPASPAPPEADRVPPEPLRAEVTP